ncbi:DUF1822 family protein [Lyngbya sp. CCAP 1446/10]|uniref:DUF1822 family protein n=1 Tax=Lyngbya sp. CCAP 1446/10 TaxID=439293 RepID=UPI00223875CB|nr:DUF1822 family protein [Lyngbya sp. CCAP 1446/10]MCW6051336.1 DUF1822 family protein [Lyngbya sp. CCAP 1446/10]
MFEFTKYSPLESQISERLRLTIDQVDLETTWQQSQHHSHPIARYNGYLNGACLNALFNWLSDWLEPENPQPLVWHGQDLASIWEVVNGTAIQIGDSRLVFIPNDESDLEEICVPQEWVDIPSWAGDYYVAVQVNLDGDDDDRCWLEVCGFATHQQLKHQGRYNAGDRTYSLAIDELTASLTVMQITLGLNLQAEVAPVLNLSEMDAAKLLQILGDSSLYSPRLKVSFEQWAAFLANDKYRQQLYHNRVANFVPVVATPTLATLLQRMNNYSQAGWKMLEQMKENFGNLDQSLVNGALSYRDGNSKSHNTIPTLTEIVNNNRNPQNQLQGIKVLGGLELGNLEAIAILTHLLETNENEALRREASVSLGKIDPTNESAGVGIGKTINLGMRFDSDRLQLVLTLTPEETDKINVHLLLRSERSPILPPNLQLSILDEDDKVFFEEQTDAADNLIEWTFTAAIGDYFQVKIAVNGVSIKEPFTV